MKKKYIIGLLFLLSGQNLLSAENKATELREVDLFSSDDFQDKVRLYSKFNVQEKRSTLIDNLKNANFKECNALIKAGAKIQAEDLYDLITDPFQSYGEILDEIVKFVLENFNFKSQINKLWYYYKDCEWNDQRTFLMIFAERGNLDLVKLLINKGASAHLTNNYGYSALYFANKKDKKEIVEFLSEIPKPEKSCVIS